MMPKYKDWMRNRNVRAHKISCGRARRVTIALARFACISLLGISAITRAETSVLSPAQITLVAQSIEKLKRVQERQMATQWSDAKKVSEFICRPVALNALKPKLKSVDRVFLGSDDPKSLSLTGNTALIGRGQARVVDGWREFSFRCEVSPVTAKVMRFDVSLLPVGGSQQDAGN